MLFLKQTVCMFFNNKMALKVAVLAVSLAHSGFDSDINVNYILTQSINVIYQNDIEHK